MFETKSLPHLIHVPKESNYETATAFDLFVPCNYSLIDCHVSLQKQNCSVRIYFYSALQEVGEEAEEEEEEDIDSLVSFHKKAMASSSSSLNSSKVKTIDFFSAFPVFASQRKKLIMVLRMQTALDYLKKIIYSLRASAGKLGNA